MLQHVKSRWIVFHGEFDGFDDQGLGGLGEVADFGHDQLLFHAGTHLIQLLPGDQKIFSITVKAQAFVILLERIF